MEENEITRLNPSSIRKRTLHLEGKNLFDILKQKTELSVAEALSRCRAKDWAGAKRHFLLASSYADRNDLKIITLNVAICWFNIGLEQEEKEDIEAALQSYAEALRFNPNYGKACYARSRLLASTIAQIDSLPDRMTRTRDAIALLRKAISIWPAYRTMALKDIDFDAIRDDGEFAALQSNITALPPQDTYRIAS